MSALQTICDAGVFVSVVENGGLSLKGLSSLPAEQKNLLIDFAKRHKQSILEELETLQTDRIDVATNPDKKTKWQQLPIICGGVACGRAYLPGSGGLVCSVNGTPVLMMSACPAGKWDRGFAVFKRGDR